jgi:hypothetical protein
VTQNAAFFFLIKKRRRTKLLQTVQQMPHCVRSAQKECILFSVSKTVT